MRISGSVRLSRLQINNQGTPVAVIEPVQPPVPPTSAPSVPESPSEPILSPALFVWSVASPELGRHRVGDQLATTLSATFNGEKVTSYSLLTGSLPPTIILAETSGILTGTLTSPGYFVFTLRARVLDSISDASYRMTVE